MTGLWSAHGGYEGHGGAVKGFGTAVGHGVVLGKEMGMSLELCFWGRRLSLRKNVVTRPPGQATVLPEAPKAFHFLLSLGPGAVSSVCLLQKLCPHPLPRQTLKDGLRPLPASCMASCGLCPVPAPANSSLLSS